MTTRRRVSGLAAGGFLALLILDALGAALFPWWSPLVVPAAFVALFLEAVVPAVVLLACMCLIGAVAWPLEVGARWLWRRTAPEQLRRWTTVIVARYPFLTVVIGLSLMMLFAVIILQVIGLPAVKPGRYELLPVETTPQGQ